MTKKALVPSADQGKGSHPRNRLLAGRQDIKDGPAMEETRNLTFPIR
jgi:hypothetical protein